MYIDLLEACNKDGRHDNVVVQPLSPLQRFREFLRIPYSFPYGKLKGILETSAQERGTAQSLGVAKTVLLDARQINLICLRHG